MNHLEAHSFFSFCTWHQTFMNRFQKVSGCYKDAEHANPYLAFIEGTY